MTVSDPSLAATILSVSTWIAMAVLSVAFLLTIRRHVVMGHEVSLQRLELHAVFQADQVIVLDGLLDRDRRLRLFNHGHDGRRRCRATQCRMNVGNQS